MSERLHIVCPACDGVNQVPAERLGDRPKCGRCKSPLFAGEPLALDDGRFGAHLTRSDLPLVVDFWAAWCGPCRAFAPQFKTAAGLYEPRARFAKVDVDAAPATAQRYDIRSIPTLVVFKGGQEAGRQIGAPAGQAFDRWLKPFLA